MSGARCVAAHAFAMACRKRSASFALRRSVALPAESLRDAEAFLPMHVQQACTHRHGRRILSGDANGIRNELPDHWDDTGHGESALLCGTAHFGLGSGLGQAAEHPNDDSESQ